MNGYLYDAFNALAERKLLRDVRLALLPSLRGEILELGGGTGASFPHYDASTHVLAIEPDRSMSDRAERRAAESDADIEILHADDRVLDDLPGESADHVVATLVLCSVDDPSATLRRIHRILKPAGTYVFIEHGRANGLTGTAQDTLTPVWRRLFCNCHLNRDFESTLQPGGFQTPKFLERTFPFPAGRVLYGFANKS